MEYPDSQPRWQRNATIQSEYPIYINQKAGGKQKYLNDICIQ